jgi:hypothetical protein
MGKLFNDITSDLQLPSEKEINEATRRAKISMTTQAKIQHNPEFAKLKANAARKTAEIRRMIPTEEHADIIKEYWSTDRERVYNDVVLEDIAKRYGTKRGAVDKIVSNFYETLSAKEYAKIKKAYYKKYPSQRSNSLKDFHANMTAEQKAKKDLNISIAQDPIDEQTALAIYNECRLNRKTKTYQSVAKKYLDKNGKKIPWKKVEKIVNGGHYATKHFNIEADLKEYNKLVLGTYEFVSPEGEVFEFDDKTECGEWMIKMEHGDDNTREPLGAVNNLFNKTIPNEPYTCIRRFWKKWTITNYK